MRFEAGLFVRFPAHVIDGIGGFVFHDALEHFPTEVQASKPLIAAFQLGNNTQRLLVVVKSVGVPVGFGQSVEGIFAGVSKRGMPQVMGEGDGFGQVFVQPERSGDAFSNLGDF